MDQVGLSLPSYQPLGKGTRRARLLVPHAIGARSKHASSWLVAALWCALLGRYPQSSGAAGQGAAKETGELSKLAEGVYAHIVDADSNAVSNAGIVVLERSVLVFDSHFTPEAGQNLLSQIQGITSKPVRYLVNSHFHPDHTHGNQAFPAATQMIGSANTRRDMLQKDLPAMNRTISIVQAQLEKMRKEMLQEQDPKQRELVRNQIHSRQSLLDRWSRQRILPPSIIADDSLSLVEEIREVELLYLGAGHTDGDLVLSLPAERIVFLGDLFFNKAIPNTQDASLLEWMKTLSEILKLEADKFVPGHGPVGTKSEVRLFLSYLEELKGLVEPAVARDESLEQVVRETTLPAKYSAYAFQNFFPSNVQKMYAELKAARQSAAPVQPPDAKPPEIGRR